MYLVAGIVRIAFGLVFIFVFVAKSAARGYGLGVAMIGILWGLFFVTFGVFDFAIGMGHPIVTPEVRSVVFNVLTIPCLLSLLWIHSTKPKK